LLPVWRVVLVVLAVLVTWRMVASSVTAYHLQLAEEGDTTAIDKLLASSPRRSEALYRKALATLEQDPTSAASLLKRAYAENPTAAAPLLALAKIARSAGNDEKATALVAKAANLMPAEPNIQRAAGNYWASKGNLGSAMEHWSHALEAYPQASSTLFPILLTLAEEPQTRGLFLPLAASPPTWWELFFAETTRRALELETVRTLYSYRRAAERVPITRTERELYVRRLKKEGKIPEAFLVWINGLNETERAHLGILNNGDFEIEPTSSGFDWHLQATDRVTSTTGATAGVGGAKALHLIFRDREKRFQHVHQPLFLDPGSYRVEGRVRTDSLDSKGGLKWIVRCLLPEASIFGESERFLGSGKWRDFSFELQVPDACTAQEIRLVSAGARDFEHKITGGIWFDRMSMRKIPTLKTRTASVNPEEGTGREQGPGTFGEQAFNALEVRGNTTFILQPSVTESLGNSNQGDRPGTLENQE